MGQMQIEQSASRILFFEKKSLSADFQFAPDGCARAPLV
jgi:hypothetical protein